MELARLVALPENQEAVIGNSRWREVERQAHASMRRRTSPSEGEIGECVKSPFRSQWAPIIQALSDDSSGNSKSRYGTSRERRQGENGD